MTHRTVAAAPAAALTSVALAAVAVVGVAGPAAAASLTVPDGDDTTMKADIDKVRIFHKSDRVKVKVFFDDLVRDVRVRSQGVSVFFDTDPEDAGPEFRLGGGLNEGTDYTLSRVEGWRDDGRPLRRCDYMGRISWSKDTVTYLVDPPCLRDVEAVAVAVKAGEAAPGGRERSDWLGEARTFTDPVARD